MSIKADEDIARDPVSGWTEAEFIRALRPIAKELKEACRKMDTILWHLFRDEE